MLGMHNWLFNAEDENGNTHYLTEEEFIGTYAEACKEAERLANEWEQRTGGLILRLELERRGAAKTAAPGNSTAAADIRMSIEDYIKLENGRL